MIIFSSFFFFSLIVCLHKYIATFPLKLHISWSFSTFNHVHWIRYSDLFSSHFPYILTILPNRIAVEHNNKQNVLIGNFLLSSILYCTYKIWFNLRVWPTFNWHSSCVLTADWHSLLQSDILYFRINESITFLRINRSWFAFA